MKSLILSVGFLAFATIAILYAKTYQYRCPKCGLILSYQQPGIIKCPSDGSNMVPKW